MLTTRGAGHRRVVVKASIVRLAGKGAGAAAAHLRYLQRDGVTREGDPGALYDRDSDAVDATPFRQSCEGDRHQFRFIVSAEDGDQYDDLKPLTRRLMAQMEIDLGTRLDWVAVDHFNTGHPHTHIVMRGVDEGGRDLVLARDYLTRGIRERAAELVDLDLGPPSPHEVAARLRREVDQERLTSIDRDLLRDAGSGRDVAITAADPMRQSLIAGRLAKLDRMGLAEPLGHGRYRLAAGLEETLKRMGERGDIIRTMQRALADRGEPRPSAEQSIFEPGHGALVGKLVARGLADEHDDRHFMIVDGLDGRTYYADIGQAEATDRVATGAVVEINATMAGVREVDRTIARIAAANGGIYDSDAHLRIDPNASDAFAETHVRRLESLRRARAGLERSADGRWAIPDDYLDRVERHEQARLRDRPVTVAMLSSQPVAALVETEAATWIDRRLVDGDGQALRDSGFGKEVREVQERRRQWLIAQELADVEGDAVRYRRGMIEILQRRELLRAAGTLEAEIGRPFSEARPGERIEGIYRRPIDLASGRFAVVERSRDFTLVPWRPALERGLDKPVSGIVREGGINWTIGRGRSGPVVS